MGPKLTMFIVFVFLAGTMLCLMMEGAFFGQEEVDLVNELTGYNILQLSGTGLWSIPKMGVGFLTNGLPKIVLWDYSFLEGGWGSLFKWIVLFPVSIGVIWGIAQMFLTTVQGIFSRFI